MPPPTNGNRQWITFLDIIYVYKLFTALMFLITFQCLRINKFVCCVQFLFSIFYYVHGGQYQLFLTYV